jgi:uncharacterized cupredoxin-like copper-binding protein
MKTVLIGLLLATLATPVLASGSHEGGHGEMTVGEPGDKSKATQTVRVTMKERTTAR